MDDTELVAEYVAILENAYREVSMKQITLLANLNVARRRVAELETQLDEIRAEADQ